MLPRDLFDDGAHYARNREICGTPTLRNATQDYVTLRDASLLRLTPYPNIA